MPLLCQLRLCRWQSVSRRSLWWRLIQPAAKQVAPLAAISCCRLVMCMRIWQLVAHVLHTMALIGLALDGVCWVSTSNDPAFLVHAVMVQIVQPAGAVPLCCPTAWLRRPIQRYGGLTAWESQAVLWWIAERPDSLAKQYNGSSGEKFGSLAVHGQLS